MEQTAFKWKKTIQGNNTLKSVKNPLRNFVEKVLPSVPLTNYPERPKQQINLSIGDPTTSLQYRTHTDNLRQAAKSVGKVDGYTDFQGIVSARQALAKRFRTKSHQITQNDVYLTAGGSMALWTVMNLLANQGDNFLTSSPCFPLSLTIGKSKGLQTRFYHLQPDKNWQANLQEIQSLIDQRTKFILVNDPSNPMGSVWSAEYKKGIINICAKRNIAILADQIYEQMSYMDQVPTFAELVQPEQLDKVTIFKCSGLTKRWLVPGWRMGWLIVYADQTKQRTLRTYLRGIFNVILMPNTIAQSALPAIIQNPNNQVKMKKCMEMMRINQQTLKTGLENEDYCSFGHSSGALYSTVIIKMQRFQSNQIENVLDFVKYLYAEQNVMLFPGTFFTGEVPFIRLVISCGVEKIQQFLVRFKRFCRRHLVK